jgi:hypothetical protein
MYDVIQAAIENSLVSIPGLPFIQFENVKYEPATGTPFLTVKMFPIDRRITALGWTGTAPEEQLYRGFYQVEINAPENEGIAYTNQISNLILDKFVSGSFHNKDSVWVTIKQSEKMRSYTESPWFRTPINLHWYTHIT